jgi:hypothetical protein
VTDVLVEEDYGPAIHWVGELTLGRPVVRPHAGRSAPIAASVLAPPDEGIMIDSERVRTLMTDIGPAMDLADVSEAADGGPWALGDQDGTVIYIENVPE